MKFYLGDSGPIEPELFELQMEQQIPALGDLSAYRSASRTGSASFQINDPAWEYVNDWAVGDAREITLTYEHVYEWSRWRRWLNAVLRFAWWPLGPPSLPVKLDMQTTFPAMTIEKIEGGMGQPLTVTMTTAPSRGVRLSGGTK